MKYYVAADIHGFYSIFRESLEQAGYFSDKGESRLVILGDLFDRGNEAKELQEFILQQMDTGKLMLIKATGDRGSWSSI